MFRSFRCEYHLTWIALLSVLIFYEMDTGLYIPHVYRKITVGGRHTGDLTLGIRGYSLDSNRTSDFLGQLISTGAFSFQNLFLSSVISKKTPNFSPQAGSA